MDNASKDAENHLRKQDRKQATKESRTVMFTGPDGTAEGEAIVEIYNDGERHFVEIWVTDQWTGKKRIVSVVGDSLGGALANAQGKFPNDCGSISLERLAADDPT